MHLKDGILVSDGSSWALSCSWGSGSLAKVSRMRMWLNTWTGQPRQLCRMVQIHRHGYVPLLAACCWW